MTGGYGSTSYHPQSETIQLHQRDMPGMPSPTVIAGGGAPEAGMGREGSFWEQYKALVKRNIIIKKRERQKTITEFALPLYFLLILVILRLTIPTPTYPAILDPHDNGSLLYSMLVIDNTTTTLHAAPHTPQVESVMSAVGSVFAGDVEYYDTEEELIEYYKLNPTEVLVAVIFPDDPLTNLSYTIRMNPAVLPLPDATERKTPETSCRADGYVVGGLEDPFNCLPNKYYATGFLGLQRLLDDALLQLSGLSSRAALREEGLSSVRLQSFPKDAVVSTNLSTLRSIVPLYMVFTWAQFILYMLVLIVDEKEKKIKEGMKMMGLQGIVYWLSWLTIYGAYVVVLATICIIVLPLSGVFQHANVGIVFVLFLLYGFSAIALALMMTPFFSKAKVAGVVGNLTQVFMSLLFYLQVYLGDEIASGYYWLMALMSPCAFSMAIDKILLLDVTGNGLGFSNIWDGPGLSFAGSLIMISVDILLYLGLALYLDAVVPTEYGTKEKPWFFLQPSFWRKRKANVQMRSYSNPSMAGLGGDDDTAAAGGGSGGSGYDALRSSSRAGSGRSSSSTGGFVANEDIEPVSPEMIGREAVIIRGLNKTFPGPRGKPPVQAVKNFSLTIYEGQITAILGHNGAGKTTLFNMLTGMTEPSGGRASIFGLDVSDSRDLREIRGMTGVCPQHDILFAVLTPREHLSFYARIRGVPEHEIKQVVEQTLSEVDLANKADSKADNLSGGQKRKLSIGIALIGDPRMIFLDEPTAGVDAYSRRRLWGLLQGRKKGKVILLTTHFMDEADVLADRKAVMTKGHVRCCGSSLFLKNKFGLGYYLTLIVDPTTAPAAVLSLLRRVVPQATLARHFGKEMAFVLPHDSTGQFSPLFRLLDQYKSKTVDDITIEDYGISMTTLEEVFLTLNNESEEDDENDLKSIKNITEELIKSKAVSSSSLANGSSTFDLHSTPVTSATTTAEASTMQGTTAQGFAIEDVQVEYSWWRAFRALLWLRTLSVIREPMAIIFMIVFPLGFTIGSMALADSQSIDPPSEKVITFTTALLSGHSVSALVHNGTGEHLSGYEAAFALDGISMADYDGLYSSIHDAQPNIAAFDVNKLSSSSSSLFGQSVSLAYNTSYLHVLPVLINLLSNAALLKDPSAINATISVSSSLLPPLQSVLEFDVSAFFAPMMIGMVYTLIPAGLAIEMVTDREIKARNLLRLNGVSFNLYFSSFFINLSMIYFIVYIGLLVIIQAFDVESFTSPPAFATLAILYLLYLPSAMVYSAAMSYIFDKSETARQFYPNMATTIGFLTYTVVSLVDMLASNEDSNPGLITHCIFSVTMPFYIPFGLLYYINKVYLICSIEGTCNHLSLSDYMTTEISLMFFMCIFNSFFYYILLRIVDARKTGGSIREALFMKVDEELDRSLWQQEVLEASKEDDDVKAERLLVQEKAKGLQAATRPPPALIYNLGKVFKGEEGVARKKKNPCTEGSEEDAPQDFVAVESVSLALQPGEVLGLLGPNGAGKTTTLKIVTAEETADRGAVWVGGGRVSSVLSPSLASLGYCPQHDCVWRRITVKEHLKLYCDVRGVKEGQLNQLLDAYLDGLQIQEHANKQSHECSGGTKRKLSYIISMMGRPGVVLLDEPSTGMDPKSKRFLWDSILASFRGQRSAVLTTHSMEEADALCSRIGIMVKGALRCVGSVQRLKNKYGGGYNLELKLSRPKKSDAANTEAAGESNLREVQNLIESTFHEASYDEPPFAERLVYKIPQSSVQSLADCFSTLEQLKASGRVVEYAFSQTTLEQVFLLFAREQDMEEEEEDDWQQPEVQISAREETERF